ncbi:MAG: aminotransferase class V-fold PLP-dependent enzyme, partial [Promethearchaeota archaeon]
SVIYTGGGMIKHVTSTSVEWADIPERFEAGTPSIVNIIVLAKFIKLVKKFGKLPKKIYSTSVKTPKDLLYQDEIFRYSNIKLLMKLKEQLIGRQFLVPTSEGFRFFVNLDNAASTRTFLPIWNTYREVLQQQKTIKKSIVEEVKKICAQFLNAPLEEYEIIFTSNTTEALNIVARSFNHLTDLVIVNTDMEHHSNELPFRYLKERTLIRIPVNDDGILDIDKLSRTLQEYNQDQSHGKKRVKLVSVSGVSNVLGTLTNLQSVSEIAHKYGAKLLVDGAQLVAHHKTDIKANNIEFFAFSAHKMYAPFGVGVLVARKSAFNYDTKELYEIQSSGEENLAGIAALGKAIVLLNKIGMNIIEDYEKELTHITLESLKKIDGIDIFGIQSTNAGNLNKRSGIIAFSIRTVPHNLAAKELAEYGGIGIRSGCFCAHIFVQQILHVQQIRILGARMTSVIMPKKTDMCLPGTLRISFGIENDAIEISHLIKILRRINNTTRSFINKLLGQTYNGTLFLPKTKTEQKIKSFVELTTRKVFL